MTEPDHSDELLARYREASAADPQRPAQRVRAAVRQHAQMVHARQPEVVTLALQTGQSSPAANQPRWKLSALGSVAVLGLAGLLVLQFEHGTPEQKEVALGVAVPGQSRKDEVVRQSAPAAVAGPQDAAPRQEPPPSGPLTQTTPASADSAAARRATPAAPPVVPDSARNAKAAALAAGAEAARAPSAFPRSPESTNATAQSIASDATSSAAPAAAAPITAQPDVSAPAPRGAANQAASPVRNTGATGARLEGSAAAPGDAQPAPAAAAPGRPRTAALAGALEKAAHPPVAAQSLRERAPLAGTSSDLAASLHAAARNGDVAQLDLLLAKGAPLNAPDDAGRTPLVLATMQGHIETVRRLLAAGANPALQDREGLDAVQHARRLGLNQIVQLIEARR